MPFHHPGLHDDIRRLSDLHVGTTARMHGAELDPETRARLRGLGLTDNSTLRVCKQGDPCVVQVGGTRIGMSRRIAREIIVLPSALADAHLSRR